MRDSLAPEPWLVALVLVVVVVVPRVNRPPPDQLLRIRPADWVRVVGWVGASILQGSSLCIVAVAVLVPELDLELRLAIAEALCVLLLIDAVKQLSGRADLIVSRRGLHFLGFRCPWSRLGLRPAGEPGIGPFEARKAGVAGFIVTALDPLWGISPRAEARLILYRWQLGPGPDSGIVLRAPRAGSRACRAAAESGSRRPDTGRAVRSGGPCGAASPPWGP